MRLYGIETEYGITREDQETVDPVVESMELVRAHLTASFERRWDYGGEDPHEDARGFRVSGLQQDKEEDEFAKVTPELVQKTAKEYLRPTNRTVYKITPGKAAPAPAEK